jgi:hypothetical protein
MYPEYRMWINVGTFASVPIILLALKLAEEHLQTEASQYLVYKIRSRPGCRTIEWFIPRSDKKALNRAIQGANNKFQSTWPIARVEGSELYRESKKLESNTMGNGEKLHRATRRNHIQRHHIHTQQRSPLRSMDTNTKSRQNSRPSKSTTLFDTMGKPRLWTPQRRSLQNNISLGEKQNDTNNLSHTKNTRSPNPSQIPRKPPNLRLDGEVLLVNEHGQVRCPKCKRTIDYWRETAENENQERYANLGVLPDVINEYQGLLRKKTIIDRLAEQKWQAEKAAIEKIGDAFGGQRTWLKLTTTLALLIAFLVIVMLYVFNRDFQAAVNQNLLAISIFLMVLAFISIFTYTYTKRGN